MKTKILMCITLVGTVFISGCTKKEDVSIETDHIVISQNMQKYMELLHADRVSSMNTDIDLTPFQNSPFDYDQYMRDLRYVVDHSYDDECSDIITADEAIIDIEQLFTMLRTLYGGYPIYQEVSFQSAKAIMIKKVQKLSAFTKTKLSDIIRSELAFLKDDHIRIAGEPLQDELISYHEDINIYEKRFTKAKDKYYRQGYESAIAKINDSREIEKYLKPIMQMDGTISYHIYVRDDVSQTQAKLLLENGEELTIDLVEEMAVSMPNKIDTEDIQGIPYVYMGVMVYQKGGTEDEEIAEAFLKKAEEFRNSRVAIIDIRQNPGGNAMLSYEWTSRFTGVKRAGLGTRILRMPLYDSAYTSLADDETVQSLADLIDYADYQEIQTGLYVEQPNDTLASNDTILFVLQDESSASAAEMLIDQLHTVKNVIFVGMPTRGAIRSSAMIPVYMEETGIKVQFGNLYGFFNPSYADEFRGIQPDLWVPSEQALEYLIPFIQRTFVQ